MADIFSKLCTQLIAIVSNRTSLSNSELLIPPYIKQSLSKQNLTLQLPKSIPECVLEFMRLTNSTNDYDIPSKLTQQTYGIQERSRSLIIFVVLIGFVSIVSIIGNLCLAKVIFAKRARLSRTDRIVLCLALSELCLVLIDSPIEIYRFVSYSFSHTWLCWFHTFFEALLSSCIIFYHLLGAFDRFVCIHGHNLSHESASSKWCRRISTKTGSIILLILPLLCSLPIAICNLLHAHVLQMSTKMKVCTVQYTHGILITILIFFYILPLLLSIVLHANLIYFIHAKHNRRYLETATITTKKSTDTFPMEHHNTLRTRMIIKKEGYELNENILNNNNNQLFQLKPINVSKRNEQCGRFNADRIYNQTSATKLSNLNDLHGEINATSNPIRLNRLCTPTDYKTKISSTILCVNNTRANANARRTVFLLVLLFSFYVLCWAPYSIYTWRHAYQIASKTQNQKLPNRTLPSNFNQTIVSLAYNLHADLRRFILINYSLYLLSMISMCFSFIFYFSLHRQARREFSQIFSRICSCSLTVTIPHGSRAQEFREPRYVQQLVKYENNNQQRNQLLTFPQFKKQQRKGIKLDIRRMSLPTRPVRKHRSHKNKYSPALPWQ